MSERTRSMSLGSALRGKRGQRVENWISVEGAEAGAGLESLADWLRGEPRLAGRVRPRAAPPQRGQMGAVAELLVVSVGAGGLLPVLAGAVGAWLSQPRRSDLRITVHAPDGRHIDIEAKQVSKAAVEEILREALREERE
ncbi:effector-associated constant component EACC1 [Streptomyces cucumeris]|uniref:effector-associated constant component EACC1 n=1 Tax=Streptomyces cucumeris TaxID=2962890 RepID=UPI003D763FE6